jgi:hypothetical protein
VADTHGMLGTLARIALMRVLPKRLIPLLTAWEVLRLVRGRQNRGRPNPEVDRSSRATRRR